MITLWEVAAPLQIPKAPYTAKEWNIARQGSREQPPAGSHVWWLPKAPGECQAGRTHVLTSQHPNQSQAGSPNAAGIPNRVCTSGTRLAALLCRARAHVALLWLSGRGSRTSRTPAGTELRLETCRCGFYTGVLSQTLTCYTQPRLLPLAHTWTHSAGFCRCCASAQAAAGFFCCTSLQYRALQRRAFTSQWLGKTRG